MKGTEKNFEALARAVIEPMKNMQVLAKEEWDFLSCNNEEWEDCWRYEFSRELQPIRGLVAQYRKFQKEEEKKKKGLSFQQIIPPEQIFGLVRSYCWIQYEFPIYLPQWPQTPFLGIPPNERRKHVRQSEENRIKCAVIGHQATKENFGTENNHGLRELFDLKEIAYFRRKKAHRFAAFEIDWRQKPAVLKKQFEIWLKSRTPKNIPQKETRGKNNFISQAKMELKALGALRLLKKMNWKRAEDFTQDISGEALFEGQSSWSRASNQAEKIIESLLRKYSG